MAFSDIFVLYLFCCYLLPFCICSCGHGICCCCFLTTVINKFCNSQTALYSILFILLLFASLLYIFLWLCICCFLETVINRLCNSQRALYSIIFILLLFASLLYLLVWPCICCFLESVILINYVIMYTVQSGTSGKKWKRAKTVPTIMVETDFDVVHCPTVGNKHWADVVNQFEQFPIWLH